MFSTPILFIFLPRGVRSNGTVNPSAQRAMVLRPILLWERGEIRVLVVLCPFYAEDGERARGFISEHQDIQYSGEIRVLTVTKFHSARIPFMFDLGPGWTDLEHQASHVLAAHGIENGSLEVLAHYNDSAQVSRLSLGAMVWPNAVSIICPWVEGIPFDSFNDRIRKSENSLLLVLKFRLTLWGQMHFNAALVALVARSSTQAPTGTSENSARLSRYSRSIDGRLVLDRHGELAATACSLRSSVFGGCHSLAGYRDFIVNAAAHKYAGQFGFDRGAQQFSAQQAAYGESKQSSQRQERTYTETRSREDVKRSFESSRQAIEEYRARSSTTLSLADCQLELELSILTITPRSPGIELSSNTLDLDEYIGNIGGELVWGGDVYKFTQSCESIRLQGTILHASCPRGKDEFVQAQLDLNEHIAYNFARRCFVAVLPDAAFTELMASANWMNFTVITRPDMRLFLQNPAFQNAISSVAQRAVDEVMNQMREVMALAVEEAVAMVSAKSEEYVQSEIETLVKMATKSAAYSGLAQLRMMELEQRRAFNVFAPYISADTLPESDDYTHTR
ncbi:hypothetical protein DFH07DRAFT_989072 [Mycena maculata]|uniref:Cyanovirin-N domain-containing protein n=1 Tax=Mycena maculata TaxID=230809 RepID=A0AAD7I3E9_9AGAR|nr:hypothetical protein DFH07DRAFT_989072 [Mycena maculata]